MQIETKFASNGCGNLSLHKQLPSLSRLRNTKLLMRKIKTLAVCLAALSIAPQAAISEVYEESFECVFSRGVANRPSPSRILFSVDEYGRSALLHEVEIPGVDTVKGSGWISRDSIRRLSINWVGQAYRYSETGRSTAKRESRGFVTDLRQTEFSLFLDRRTMRAIARATTRGGDKSWHSSANGSCSETTAPKTN